jgi:hypothetical protein
MQGKSKEGRKQWFLKTIESREGLRRILLVEVRWNLKILAGEGLA